MAAKPRVLLTGATGFVGTALLKYLLNENYLVSVIGRNRVDVASPNLDELLVDDLSAICQQDSSLAISVANKLQHVDLIVHCAGLAHNINRSSSVEPFYRVNRDVTAGLASLAAQAGVRRFVFISTIAVNGNQTRSSLSRDLSEYFTETDLPNPHNDYARSKLQAEDALSEIRRSNGMEVTIIRPPLIYGVNAKGNFALLKKVVDKGIPLPFDSVNNLRSVVALDNLVDFIGLCLTHPNAANQVFLIADGEDISTPDLLRQVAKASGKKMCLFPFPVRLLASSANLLGKQKLATSLFGSLRLDISKAINLLGWRPVITMTQQLEKIWSDVDDGSPPARE